MRPFFVYMLRCGDGSYYVGHTDDLETRVAQHGDGTLGGYTSSRRPVELVWCAELATRDEALEREFQVKHWTRRKKEALIASDWQRLKQLARGADRSPVRPSTSREPDGSRYAQDERDLSPHQDERSRSQARDERDLSQAHGDERRPSPRGERRPSPRGEGASAPSVRPERSARNGADLPSCAGAKSKGERAEPGHA